MMPNNRIVAVDILSNLLHENKIDFIVLNGLSLARLNTEPTSCMEDGIDFYVFSKDREKALMLLKEHLQAPEDDSSGYCQYTIGSIPCKLFYQTAFWDSKSKQRYWDDLIDCYFGDILDHVKINDVEIPILPPTLYAINLFAHIYNLYKNQSLTIEHFLEWKKFFEETHNEIVVQELAAKLDKLGMLRVFNTFGVVLVKALDMDERCFPYPIMGANQLSIAKIMKRIKNVRSDSGSLLFNL
jgi:hypothetical protein